MKYVRCLFLFFCFFLVLIKSRAEVYVYVVAHQDDWQLFMGTSAYWDIKSIKTNPENIVVFVHVTAGQSGKYSNNIWWSTREECAMNSIRHAVDAGQVPSQHVVSGYWDVPGNKNHKIYYRKYGNVWSFFLRVWDGCSGQPGGCDGRSDQSLGNLHNGTIKVLKTLDKSTSYEGWKDLQITLINLLYPFYDYNNITAPGTRLWINHQESDARLNPYDNPDHLYAGLLAKEATGVFCPHFVAYLDYCTGDMPTNISIENVKMEAGMFSACNMAIINHGFLSPWENEGAFNNHMKYLDKNYYKVWDLGEGCKPQRQMLGPGNALLFKVETKADIQYKYKLRMLGLSDTSLFHVNSMARAYASISGGILNISLFVNNKKAIPVAIEVVDPQGKVPSHKLAMQTQINIADLPAGIYFARVYYKEESYKVVKFYKK